MESGSGLVDVKNTWEMPVKKGEKKKRREENFLHPNLLDT